jgi:hypothetical protein
MRERNVSSACLRRPQLYSCTEIRVGRVSRRLPTRLLLKIMALLLLFVDLTFREFREHRIKDCFALE